MVCQLNLRKGSSIAAMEMGRETSRRIRKTTTEGPTNPAMSFRLASRPRTKKMLICITPVIPLKKWTSSFLFSIS